MKRILNKKIIILIVAITIISLGISVSAKGINLNILDDYGRTSQASCSGYFGSADKEGTLMYLLVNYVFKPTRILVPVLLVVLTTIDFARVVFTDDKDAMDKARKNFVKRAIMGVVIFFIPYILELLFSIFDEWQVNSCLSHFQ